MNTNFESLKPNIKELIHFYYNECDHGAGGPHLHYMLEDGNISHAGIYTSKEECYEANDFMAALICEVLLLFTEEEIEAMYEDNWGME